jgi:membrane-associated phospholipid phosphatase
MGAVLFAAALAVDRPVAHWVQDNKPIKLKDQHWKLFKRPGEFKYLVPIVIAVGLLHPLKWRGAMVLLTASAISGVMYSGKWFFGRMRPAHVIEPFTFHPFIEGWRGFLGVEDLSFPSGHTSLAFAFAMALAFLLPRGRVVFFPIAAGVGVERVLEGAHYPSDVVAGAAAGMLSGLLAIRLGRRFFGVPSSDPTPATLIERAARPDEPVGV